MVVSITMSNERQNGSPREHADKHGLRQFMSTVAKEIAVWALHLEKNPEMINNKLLRKGIRLPFGWQDALYSDKFEDGYFALLNRTPSGLKQEHALDPQLRPGLSYALLIYNRQRELSCGYYLTVSDKNNQKVEVQKVSANDVMLDCDSRKPAEEQLDESDRVLINKISMKMHSKLMEKTEKMKKRSKF